MPKPSGHELGHNTFGHEYGSARRRTGVTKALRRVLAKFAVIATTVGAQPSGRCTMAAKLKILQPRKNDFDGMSKFAVV